MASINDSTRTDDWSVGGIHKRDFNQSKGGPEELPHRPKKGKKSPRKKPGCVGNDGGSHVYVLVKYVIEKDSLSWYGNIRVRQECLGCGRKGRSYWKAHPDDSLIYETRRVKDIWELW